MFSSVYWFWRTTAENWWHSWCETGEPSSDHQNIPRSSVLHLTDLKRHITFTQRIWLATKICWIHVSISHISCNHIADVLYLLMFANFAFIAATNWNNDIDEQLADASQPIIADMSYQVQLAATFSSFACLTVSSWNSTSDMNIFQNTWHRTMSLQFSCWYDGTKTETI